MKNYYKISKKQFKKVLKRHRDITYHVWNRYAHLYHYFSAITIMSHEDADDFKDLKEKFLLFG